MPVLGAGGLAGGPVSSAPPPEIAGALEGITVATTGNFALITQELVPIAPQLTVLWAAVMTVGLAVFSR